MPWLKLDDSAGEHRKTRRLLRAGGLEAFGLHALAMLHASRYLTDGFVEREHVDEVLDAAKVRGRQRTAVVDALVEGGQWEPVEGGFSLHDYLDYNPSREQVLAQRRRESARKAAGRRTESGGSPPGVRRVSDGPDPTRPVLPPLTPPPAGGRQRDRDRFTAWCRSVAAGYPDPEAALPAVRRAVDTAGVEDLAGVQAWIARFCPELGEPSVAA